jgi:hypothetical protein
LQTESHPSGLIAATGDSLSTNLSIATVTSGFLRIDLYALTNDSP